MAKQCSWAYLTQLGTLKKVMCCHCYGEFGNGESVPHHWHTAKPWMSPCKSELSDLHFRPTLCSYQFWWPCLIARCIVCWYNFLSRKFYFMILNVLSEHLLFVLLLLCYASSSCACVCVCVCVCVCWIEIIWYMYCFVISNPGSTKVVCFDVQRKSGTHEIIAV